MIERRCAALKPSWGTGTLDSVHYASLRAVRAVRYIPTYIKIEKAVAIVVKENSTAMDLGTEFGAANTGFLCDIREGPVAVVVVQNIGSVLRHKQVRKAVVVIVPPDAAHTVAGARHSGLLGHVGKGSVSVVVIEGVSRLALAFVDVATVREVDIGPSIAVIVRDTYAGTLFGQDHRRIFCALEMYKSDPCGLSDIGEVNG